MADVDHRFTVNDAVYQELKSRIDANVPKLGVDWLALKKRWDTDHTALSAKLTLMNVTSTLPANMVAAEPQYQQILGYVEGDSGDPNFHPNDSIRGIELQFQKLRGTPIDIDTGRPSLQGPPPTDPDEQFLKNQTIQAVANAGKKVADNLTGKDTTLRNIGIGVGIALAAVLGIKILK